MNYRKVRKKGVITELRDTSFLGRKEHKFVRIFPGFALWSF
jgi:hypothetical protein